MNKHIFTTSAGVEVEFIPPSATAMEMAEAGFIEDLKAAGRQVDVPMKTVHLAEGETDKVPHDAETTKTPAEQAAWEDYLKVQDEIKIEQGKIRTQFALEALKIELPVDDSWIINQKRHRIRIPENTADDPRALLDHWIKTELLRTTKDIYDCMIKVMASAYEGSVSDADIEAASRTFRNSLPKARMEAAQAAKQTAAPKAKRRSRKVAAQ